MLETIKGANKANIDSGINNVMQDIKKAELKQDDIFKDNEVENNNDIKGIPEAQNKDKKEEKKIEKENIEDKDIKFVQFKKEGYKTLKEGIFAIIFSNEGINLEGLKKIQLQFDNIKKTHEEINDFFKVNFEEDQEEVEKELELFRKEFEENNN